MHLISHETGDTSLYIRVRTGVGFFRWMPVDFENDIGTGYSKFGVGDMKYNSNFKMVEVAFQSLQFLKNSKANPVEVEYVLLISNSSDELDAGAQC